MKTTVYYGLEPRTIKTMCIEFPGLDRAIENTRKMAKEIALYADNHKAEVSSIHETNKGTAITIRVKI